MFGRNDEFPNGSPLSLFSILRIRNVLLSTPLKAGPPVLGDYFIYLTLLLVSRFHPFRLLRLETCIVSTFDTSDHPATF